MFGVKLITIKINGIAIIIRSKINKGRRKNKKKNIVYLVQSGDQKNQFDIIVLFSFLF
jgi:hypothetical protein